MVDQELHSQLDAAMDKLMPRPLGKEDWHYRDMYSWLREDYWEEFLAIMGPEDHIMIIGSSRFSPEDGRVYKRGQFFISPTGMARMKAYNAARQSEGATKQ